MRGGPTQLDRPLPGQTRSQNFSSTSAAVVAGKFINQKKKRAGAAGRSPRVTQALECVSPERTKLTSVLHTTSPHPPPPQWEHKWIVRLRTGDPNFRGRRVIFAFYEGSFGILESPPRPWAADASEAHYEAATHTMMK